MLKKVALVAAAASSAFIALPAAANAQSYGYYDGGRYDRNYRGDRYRGERYDRRYSRNNYYGNRSYNGNRGHYRDRCGSGTTGTIVGGVAGALLGREVTRDNRGYNRNSGTTGAIVGGALGALAGRAIDRGDCR